MAGLGVAAVLVAAMSCLFIVPVVFSFVPISAGQDALTLCLPGIGPLQRFAEDLRGEHEELVYIHEDAHAKQCRRMGASGFARSVTSTRGRLAMEAQALCAEAAMLSVRGVGRERLFEHTVEVLATEYFADGEIGRHEIAAAVGGACGVVSSE